MKKEVNRVMRKKLRILMSLLIPLVFSLAMVPVRAPLDTYAITIIHSPQVYIDPALTEDPTATQLTINIVVTPFLNETQIYNATTHELIETQYSTIQIDDLWGVQLSLQYNPLIVHGLSKSVNLAFLGSDGGSATELAGAGFDDEAGELRLFGMFLAETEDSEVAPEVYEDTVLATVTFEVVGSGVTGLVLGEDTKLKNTWGEDIPRELSYGTFRNADAQLWMGPSKGGKIWPEWKQGFVGQPQILYGRLTNLGDGGVYVRIRFIVSSVFGTEEVWSNEVWAASGETVTVSTVYQPPGPSQYLIRGVIEFMYDGVAFIDYSSMEAVLGGDGVTRDIGTKFWVN